MDNDQLQLFENKTIRTVWDEETEEWYFSVVDVVAVLTEQETQRGASTYWAVLKKRLKTLFDRCCDDRAAPAYHSIHPITKGGAV